MHEETHIRHVIQEVRVAKLLGSLITQGLLVLTRAFTVARDNRVLNHFALHALEVLKLVAHLASVAEVDQASLYKALV